jgi:hypothetical protein
MTNARDEAAFDPETITLLAGVLDRVWTSLSAEQQAAATRAHVAEYILTLAAHGERSATQLYDSVLNHFRKLST